MRTLKSRGRDFKANCSSHCLSLFWGGGGGERESLFQNLTQIFLMVNPPHSPTHPNPFIARRSSKWSSGRQSISFRLCFPRPPPPRRAAGLRRKSQVASLPLFFYREGKGKSLERGQRRFKAAGTGEAPGVVLPYLGWIRRRFDFLFQRCFTCSHPPTPFLIIGSIRFKQGEKHGSMQALCSKVLRAGRREERESKVRFMFPYEVISRKGKTP